MSLRTYPLITHPAYLSYVEGGLTLGDNYSAKPAEIPEHRPLINDVYDIAGYIGVSPDIIRSVIKFKNRHYRSFDIKKRSGGMREISAPRTFLKVLQWWILDCVLVNSYVPEFVFGFVRGKSFIDNARSHIGSRHVLNVDVKDFFGSVTFSQVQSVFEDLGYSRDVSRGLAEIVTLSGALPQGAPTSPMLANLIFSKIDYSIKQMSDGFGLKYTRYADDLTFSSTARIEYSIIERISGEIGALGLRLNPDKTRFMGPNQSREVTGLIVGDSDVSLKRDYLNSLRGYFHRVYCKPHNYVVEKSRIAGSLQLVKQVRGRGSLPIIALGEKAVAAIEMARSDR